jgi:hypothetical protein
MEVKESRCFKCRHFRMFIGGCDAFPNGIPEEITSGENDHSHPIPGQENDIVFEPFEPLEIEHVLF